MNDRQICLLWDLDGTIIDSIDLHFESWRQAFQKYDKPITRSKFEETFGSNNHICIAGFLGYQPDERLFTEVSELKEQIFRDLALEHGRLFPGVLAWLSYFNKQNIKQAIASSAPLENINSVINAFDLSKYFNAVVSGITLPSKPEPDIFLEAAKILKCKPCHAIVIEDSAQGLISGKAAGMLTVGLVSTQPKDRIVADVVLDNFLSKPEDFLQLITKLMASRPSADNRSTC